jgi:hypothetical protein
MHDEDDEAEVEVEAEPEETHRRASLVRARTPPAPPDDAQDPLEKQARTAETIDDRVFVIAQLLMQGRWTKHRALMLANLWAVGPAAIKKYATDAARLTRQLKGADGLKALRRKVEARLDLAFEMALASGDAKAAVQAARALGDLGGLFGQKRVGKNEETPTEPGKAPLPPMVQQVAQHPEALRYWALAGKRPTPAQVAQFASGATAEQVAQAAGLALKPPGAS